MQESQPMTAEAERRHIRIVLIHSAFVSPEQAGGTRHYEFARRLVSQGHGFAIVTSNLSYLTGQQSGGGGLVEHETLDGIDIYRAYTYQSLHRSFTWRVISFLSFAASSLYAGLRAGKADLVMGTTPPIFQAVSACVVAAVRRKPFLLEVRDLWPDFAIEMGVLKNPVLIGMSRWLEGVLYRRAAHLLVNSPAYRDYLIGKGVAPEKITVVANGVDPAMFSPDARGEQVRQQYGLAGKFVVTYAGALGMANDIDTILRAAARLKDEEPQVHFLLVGDGKERSKLEESARALGLNNVTFTGAQAKSRMSEFLAASDACVATLKNIPMFNTTYPNKVFDYMAAARPTILAIDGVIREVVEGVQGGIFVPPGDDEALARAASRLSREPVLCRQMGANARACVVQNFNRDRQAQAFLDLVLQVAGVSRGPSSTVGSPAANTN